MQGVFFLLNPPAIVLFMWWSAVLVECFFLGTVLCSDARYVACAVWKKALLQCFCSFVLAIYEQICQSFCLCGMCCVLWY